MINWIKANKDFLNIRAIEQEIGCPKDTIQRALTGKAELPKKWIAKLKNFVYNNFTLSKFEYGREFSINGYIFYPAYLDRDSLIEISVKFKKVLSENNNYEVRISRIMAGKGIEWELIENNRENSYILVILPNWSIQIMSPSHVKASAFELLEEIIDSKLIEVENEFKKTEKMPPKHIFLQDDNSHILIGLNNSPSL